MDRAQQMLTGQIGPLRRAGRRGHHQWQNVVSLIGAAQLY